LRIVFVLLVALAAHAQEAPPCEAKDPTTAEVNSREGVRLAKEGRYGEAAALFRIAVRLDDCAPDHQLLLARSLSRSGNRDAAMHGYASVIERFPGTPVAARAQKELDELEAMPEVKPAPPETVTKPVPPPEKRPPWDLIGYGTAGVGVALIGAGVFFAFDAQDADDALAARPESRTRYDELVDQRDSSTTLAYAFYGLGVAAIGAGALMAFVLHEPAPAPADGSLAFVPTRGGAALLLGGSF
jgi:tetratricopeptide (TPR) repeat protein